MITEAQYHEALEINLFQENLQLWEKWRKERPEERLNLNRFIAETKAALKELTGNERGFLNG
jgi:hypothetical protein